MSDGEQLPDSLPPVDDLASPERLDAVAASGVAEARGVDALDALATEAASALGAPVSVISMSYAEHQVHPGAVGLAEPLSSRRSVPVSDSFCQYVVGSGRTFQVNDGRKDPRVASSWPVRELGIVAYLGQPIRGAEGKVVGAFCVADGVSHAWRQEDRDLLNTYARRAEEWIRDQSPPAGSESADH